MKTIASISCVLLLMFSTISVKSQHNKSILFLWDGSRVIGKMIRQTDTHCYFKIATGDTLEISKLGIRKASKFTLSSNFGRPYNAMIKDKNPKNDKTLVYLQDGSKIIAHSVNKNERHLDFVMLTDDSVSIPDFYVRKTLDDNDIFLYRKGKHHFKTGWYTDVSFSTSVGPAGSTSIFDLSYNRRLNTRLSAGVGLGWHNNMASFGAEGLDRQFISVSSVPIWLQGRYYLTDRSVRFFATAKAGYAKNLEVFNTIEAKDGLLLQGGFGFAFASKKIIKHYIILQQYTSKASGVQREVDLRRVPFDINFDLWFNRITFTWGMEIGH